MSGYLPLISYISHNYNVMEDVRLMGVKNHRAFAYDLRCLVMGQGSHAGELEFH